MLENWEQTNNNLSTELRTWRLKSVEIGLYKKLLYRLRDIF